MAALSPGQSPPLVKIPMHFARAACMETVLFITPEDCYDFVLSGRSARGDGCFPRDWERRYECTSQVGRYRGRCSSARIGRRADSARNHLDVAFLAATLASWRWRNRQAGINDSQAKAHACEAPRMDGRDRTL